MKFRILLSLALGTGLLIGWVDTRPTWDDTGITVGAIVGSAALLGIAMPEHAWVWALAASSGTAILNVVLLGNLGGLIALPVAFAGSYGGAFLLTALQTISSNGKGRPDRGHRSQ